MIAQRLNKKIVIEQAAVTRSASGAEVRTWSAIAGVWAEAAYQGGREMTAARTVHPEADVVWIIRAGRTVTPKMRIRYGERLFDVVGVDDLSDRDRVRLICKEGARP